MTLGEKQRLFTKLIAQLILWAYDHGYELTWGEAWRTPEQAAYNAKMGRGIINSLHRDRLAIDFNLFIDGVWKISTEDFREMGEHWETMHELARWGGRFNDGNHFSLEHAGRK